jgi:DNA-binding response OmpR family regulator
MQWRYTALVERVRVCASIDEVRDQDLLERVWDEHADPFTKTVYVTVSRLRRKLGDPEVITNVARVGYRISG